MTTRLINLHFFNITFVTTSCLSWQHPIIQTHDGEIELCMGRLKVYASFGQPLAA